jgi:transcription-repair coupling factor (superfamily II helicase)
VASQEAKLDLYRRLTDLTDPAHIDALRAEARDRFGPLPSPAEAFFATALLRVVGGALGIEGVIVRGDEARITFRDAAVPRMKALSAAFHDVQFQAEIRRAQPLSLKLTRLGGADMLLGLTRALRGLVASGSSELARAAAS